MRESKTARIKGASAHRAPRAITDVTVTCEGRSLFLFHVHTVTAEKWLEDNVAGEHTWMGHALVVEHRFAEGLAHAIAAAGMVIK